METDALREILCGSLAGMSGKLVEYPFDTIKVRLQTQPRGITAEGPWQCFKATMKNEGIRGLYQGLPSPLLGAMMENAVLFWIYRSAESWMLSNWNKKTQDIAKSRLELPLVGVAGCLAGFGAAVVLTPIELVKCRVQIQEFHAKGSSTDPVMPSKGTFRMFLDLLKSGSGLSTFYRGFHYTAIRECGGGAVWFGTYEFFCRKFRDGNAEGNLGHLQLMCAGAAAGVAYNVSFFPFDVMKSIVQTSKEQVKMRDLAKKIFNQHGIRGFYRGLGVTVVRAVPGNAAVFFVYEQLSKAWRNNAAST